MSNIITVAQVRGIGTSEISKQEHAARIIAGVPEGYDWSKRGAVPGAVFLALGMSKSDAPEQKVDGKETTFGVGFRVLADAVRAQLERSDDKPAVMRVSLKGVGSAVVPADHPAYSSLLELLSGN